MNKIVPTETSDEETMRNKQGKHGNSMINTLKDNDETQLISQQSENMKERKQHARYIKHKRNA